MANLITKIYLDMDGVLCDFHKRYRELFDVADSEINHKHCKWDEYWKKFVFEKNFETLEWHPGGRQLYAYVKSLGVPFEILSSSGGELYYDEIRDQKIRWLSENGFDCPIHVVRSKKYKRDYAAKTHLLIDDNFEIIEEFREAGGRAIWHNSIDKTLSVLRYIEVDV